MNTEKYPYIKADVSAQFKFESRGPNGAIKKMVIYKLLGTLADETLLFNLGFGDYNEMEESYNDLTVSNNEDRLKVLATVAGTVMEFTAPYEKIAIHAVGSTPSRTRLYQMGINAYREEIETHFKILGYSDDCWQEFKSGINYEAFLAIKK
ncbi:hypothetical protein [[Flexibacter] sp. ATCC 35208]|uniref:DUF6934 family protein n=1 Tax=[Flexibacter] sp. ATCC 35208 TaxID=1936242 RepID=UPI0009D12B57|nr:hypothetical protein [[Flexibacter] sp. ATCC 35208]OMP76492.1 hypothetical protein BW716_24555 [[Flexibacter] sp. ATCC 35208]